MRIKRTLLLIAAPIVIVAVAAYAVWPAVDDADPQATLVGLVLTPTGQPAVGAEVVSCGKRCSVHVRGPHLDPSDRTFAGVTDAAGRFTVPFDATADILLVAHESGFTEVPLQPMFTANPINLQKWAKVDGRLFVRGEPAPNATVVFFESGFSSLRRRWLVSSQHYVRRTGTDGRFSFDQVPPGGRVLYHSPESPKALLRKTPVVAVAGQSITVEMGLIGGRSQVIGRLVLSDTNLVVNWPNQSSAHIALKYRPRPGPVGERSSSALEPLLEHGRYHFSASGKYELDFSDPTALEVDEQGRFVVRGLHPGTNELRVFVREPTASNQKIGRVFASHTSLLVLSESDLAQCHDLGDIEVIVRGQLLPGGRVPDFSARTLEGGEISLASLRGKFVLLDFWATWCRPCVAEMPNLRATYESFGSDKRFVLLSLSVDEDRDALARFIAREQPGWRQGWLGRNSKVPELYGGNGIPAFFLISPDGKLIESGMRGPGIKAAVERALQNAEAGAK